MKKIIFLTCLMMPLLANAEDAKISADIAAVKRSVLELNKDLYELEEALMSPATTRAEVYFSLLHGEFFEPLSVEVTARGIDPVHHVYTERQVSALRMGAVQPLAKLTFGPGRHNVRAVVRGIDHMGQSRELVVERTVEKNDKPLLMEIVVSDNGERQNASAELRTW